MIVDVLTLLVLVGLVLEVRKLRRVLAQPENEVQIKQLATQIQHIRERLQASVNKGE